MPVIHLEYDDSKISDQKIKELSEATQKIVSEVTGIEDVFVYGNSATIKIKIAPIEIFVFMSRHKIKDLNALTNQIKAGLQEWKKESSFSELINLSVTPMDWQIEIGI